MEQTGRVPGPHWEQTDRKLSERFPEQIPAVFEGTVSGEQPDKQEQAEREENDNNNHNKLNDEFQKINSLIAAEKKNREETQEGILEMIKIMNERMKNDLDLEKKEREQNEEVLIELLENTCGRLQQNSN